MTNHEDNQKSKVIFPQNASEIIDSIIKKHNLPTILDLLESEATGEEFKEEWKNDPGFCIAQILKEYSQGKIKSESLLANNLMERLNISEEAAQKLADDLQKQILNSVYLTQEKTEKPKTTENTSKEEPPSSKKSDAYREPIK